MIKQSTINSNCCSEYWKNLYQNKNNTKRYRFSTKLIAILNVQ